MSFARQHVAPAAFVLIWATGFIVARYGMPYAGPFGFLALRFCLSIVCFLLWIGWAKIPWPSSPQQWGHIAVTGVLMHAAYLGCVWSAVKAGMGSGMVALVIGLQPVLTATWLTRLSAKKQAILPQQWLGLLLGFFGLSLVVSSKLHLQTLGDHISAPNMAWAVLALLSITAGTLYQKRYVTPCDPRSANTVQLLAATVLTVPLALWENASIVWNSAFIAAMSWSVLGLTLGGSSLLYMLIQRGAAASVASLMYLVPPTTALMAWFLFDEPITLSTLAGIACTALGVALALHRRRLLG